MRALLVGYARCSTDAQDFTAQRDGLTRLGVAAEQIYVDYADLPSAITLRAKGFATKVGITRALAACRAGDTLVVTKLDRLARSLPDARAIADELTTGQVRGSSGRHNGLSTN